MLKSASTLLKNDIIFNKYTAYQITCENLAKELGIQYFQHQQNVTMKLFVYSFWLIFDIKILKRSEKGFKTC